MGMIVGRLVCLVESGMTYQLELTSDVVFKPYGSVSGSDPHRDTGDGVDNVEFRPAYSGLFHSDVRPKNSDTSKVREAPSKILVRSAAAYF